jgi:uncharacterized MnhB-related membrane protein
MDATPSKNLNEKRRELIGILLLVGGIVGGIVSGLRSETTVLQVLILFVVISVLAYAILLSEVTRNMISYKVIVFGVSFAFASLLFVIMNGASINLVEGLVTLVLVTFVITFALIYDWNKQAQH